MNLQARDITLKWVRENFDIEAEKIMIPNPVWKGELSIPTGSFGVEEFVEKIKSEIEQYIRISGSSENISDYTVEVNYIGHCGEQEVTVYENVPRLENNLECEARIQKREKDEIKIQTKREKDYHQYLKLKEKFEPEDQ